MSDNEVIWGVGYGARRHIVNTATFFANPWGAVEAEAQCSASTRLDKFSNQDGTAWTGQPTGEYVTGLRPCARCQKRAEADL